MPYILKEDRPFYNAVVHTILSQMYCSHIGFNLKKYVVVLAKKLNSVDLKAVDGHFNYFITKLLIEAGLLGKITFASTEEADILNDFLIRVMRKVYLPQCYFNYNRGVGMVTSCKKEFRRVFSKDKIIAIEDFLEHVSDNFYLDIVGPYEDKKIEANGKV